MDDQASYIIEPMMLAEGAMAAFVSQLPEAGEDEALGELVG